MGDIFMGIGVVSSVILGIIGAFMLHPGLGILTIAGCLFAFILYLATE